MVMRIYPYNPGHVTPQVRMLYLRRLVYPISDNGRLFGGCTWMRGAYIRALLLAVVGLLHLSPICVGATNIIPKPQSLEYGRGSFVLKDKMSIGYSAGLSELATYLQDILNASTGYNLSVQSLRKSSTIHLILDSNKVKATEGYRLEVHPRKIYIYGASPAGVFYGVQSLLQLFPADIHSRWPRRGVAWTAPAVIVNDAPERPWRGMMLDVARYFYDKEFVMKFIDMMAMYKMNKLQFHLIDDSGWRLEIKKYPRLTEVGAFAGPKEKRIGGYYTQEDIKEIIAYASLRQVEVIPEIEFPAHIQSAVVAYPWLSCRGEQLELPTQHFISRELLCPGKETSIQFLSDVLEETVRLFPSRYINIGGDEAVYDRWKECPHCQALMVREGLQDASKLQGYLVNRVSDMMKAVGRTVVGWEEIIRRGEVKNPVVALIWRNVSDSIVATQTGHQAVLTPATELYLDFPEHKIPGEVQAATWRPPVSVEKSYNMPLNDYSERSTVIGIQGCFWTDQFIHGTQLQELQPLDENRSERYAEYLIFPRLLAISELGWGRPSKRDYQDFAQRLKQHYARLDSKDCFYRLPQPTIVQEQRTAQGSYIFTLEPSVPGTKILYTTNGTYPHRHSAEYTSPVEVTDKSLFHAITYKDSRRYSLPIYFAPDYSAYKQYGAFVSEWTPMQIQRRPFVLKIDATGKLSSDGVYEISLIRTKGAHPLNLSGLQLLKRQELLTELQQAATLDDECSVHTYRFRLEGFEAGTPFYIHIPANGEQGNDSSGLIFIKKAD